MTSKRCFSKLLREDFRHKIWMLALSVLGNLLAIPVCFLLRAGEHPYSTANAAQIFRAASDAVYGFQTYISVLAGIIACVGALIVGLAGFRYVFHRDMTDTYHSIPVRRRTLFLVNWLNGFLIWFVPFVVCMLGTMLLSVGRLKRLTAAFETAAEKNPTVTANFAKLSAGKSVAEGLLTVVTLAVAFMLVYHLVLAAVMLCGNVLNTLVLTGVVGTGVAALYTLFVTFQSSYFETFAFSQVVSPVEGRIVYASPLVSAIWLIDARQSGAENLLTCICVNAAVALLLFGVAFLAYLHRPSELAETGIKSRTVRWLEQLVATFVAGLGGWLVFYYLTDGLSKAGKLAWGVFGTLLAAVLVSGVMEILFQMDLRAFFSHKLRMALSLAGVLLVCFSFSCDWFGYDSYLPKKDEIAELSVYDAERSSLYSYSYIEESLKNRMDEMHYTDVDVIYDYLRTAVDEAGVSEEQAKETTNYDSERSGSERIITRVTLKNGRSYYRKYSVYSDRCDAARKILTSEEYTGLYYQVPEEELASLSGFALERNHQSLQRQGTDISTEELEAICRAYNQDLAERPELVVCGEGRQFANIDLRKGENFRTYWHFPVYEQMTHTREMLRQYGYEEYAEPVAAEEIDKIKIYLGWSGYELKEENRDPVEVAREYFGAQDGTGQTEMTQDVETVEMPDEELVLEITAEEEIEELLGIISYVGGEYAGAFGQTRVGNIKIITTDEQEISAWVPRGAMPEKYLLRFGKLTK